MHELLMYYINIYIYIKEGVWGGGGIPQYYAFLLLFLLIVGTFVAEKVRS